LTIAACYVSSEGVVLGADSTASYGSPAGLHYYNHAQKVFEIGEGSTLGLVMWGLGGLGYLSHRTMLADLADNLAAKPPANVADVMARWIKVYEAARTAFFAQNPDYQAALTQCRALAAKPAWAKANAPPGARTEQEENQFQDLRLSLTTGFCIGGYVLPDRTPTAQTVLFDPVATATPKPEALTFGWRFWGAPNMIQRLIFGADDATKGAILNSGMWTGDLAALNGVLSQHTLAHPVIPLRDAVDFVHACIYSTVKALKFSHFSQICGGPIELAVISSDRKFRWVRHKPWDAAIVDGALP
jgi:hypothetical protein